MALRSGRQLEGGRGGERVRSVWRWEGGGNYREAEGAREYGVYGVMEREAVRERERDRATERFDQAQTPGYVAGM